MLDLNKIFLYRITHIENISHILHHGITYPSSINANPKFVPIGDQSLIVIRNKFELKNGRKLGDYIPFYFSTRTPMLYVVQKGYNMVQAIPPENIVYCITSVQEIINLDLDFIFTDGHAINGLTSQYAKEDVHNIGSIVDWDAIEEKYWKSDHDLDLKRRKEAEFLVSGDIPANAILRYVVYNQSAMDKIVNFGAKPSAVIVNQEYYF